MKRQKFVLLLLMLLAAAPAMPAEINLDIGWWEVIKWSLGFDREKDTRTPLEKAIDLPEDSPEALTKKLARLDKLLANGADVNAVNTSGYSSSTPLMRASHDADTAIVRRLLAAGADVNARHPGALTPLMHASRNRDPAVARLLLDAGADPNAKMRRSRLGGEVDTDSVLIMAAEVGNRDLMALLLDRGTLVNYRPQFGDLGGSLYGAALHHAIRSGNYEFTKSLPAAEKRLAVESSDAAVQLLLERGADPNLAEYDEIGGKTPLLLAIEDHRHTLVSLLIKYGAQSNRRGGHDGHVPLTAAAFHGDAASLKILLAHGADVRAVDGQGRNALTAAVTGLADSNVKLDIVEQLLAAGAPVNARSGGLSTTLIRAIRGAQGTITAAGSLSIGKHETELLLRLIELGADLDAVDSRGITALELARISQYQELRPVAEVIERRLSSAEHVRIEKLSKTYPTIPPHETAAARSPTDPPVLLPTRRVPLPEAVSALAVSPDGRLVATSGRSGVLRLWDAADGVALRELSGHTAPVTSLAFARDAKHLLSGSLDASLRLWEVATGKEVRQFSGHGGYVTAIGFFPDGKSLFSASKDFTLRRWDTESGRTMMIYAGGGDGSVGDGSVDVSPDGRTLISRGGGRGAIYEWNVASGKIQRIHNVSQGYHLVRFSPDGRTIFSDLDAGPRHIGPGETAFRGGGGGFVLFDAASGQEHFRVMPHRIRVMAAAFSPDGQRVVSASADGDLRLYTTASGAPLAVMSAHRGSVGAVAFLPDGHTMVSGGDDKTLTFWAMPP